MGGWGAAVLDGRNRRYPGAESGRPSTCSQNRPNEWRVVNEKGSGREEVGSARGNQIT